jgi:hypothetical protein
MTHTQYTQGSILVGTKAGTHPAWMKTIAFLCRLKIRDHFLLFDIYVLTVPVGSERKWVERFNKLPFVNFTEIPFYFDECFSPPIGGDRDEHGCLGAAGYSWCKKQQKCVRKWQEPCAECEMKNDCP